MEVIKAFMKTKENGGKHIQDIERMTEELQQYPCLYEIKINMEIKDTKRETKREILGEQF